MEAAKELIASKVSLLKAGQDVQQGVSEFVAQVIELYHKDLASVSAFGSAVTGDYDKAESDVNILVIHSELDIGDLERVAKLSRRWLQKQKLAPRFISQRNLEDASRYFQIDFLTMRDSHVVLCGEDLLSGIGMFPVELKWQIAYEIKAMRMRIKQQFWRAADNPKMMRTVLVDRFTSLLHIARALLLLERLPAPVLRAEIIRSGSEHLGLDPEFSAEMMRLRQNPSPPDRILLMPLFEGLMNMIRTLDSRVEGVSL
jgi:predicted nucleotidyltransferase